MRNDDPRWQAGNFEKNVEATGQLVQLAESKAISVAQLALAWLLAQGDDIVPIPARAARDGCPASRGRGECTHRDIQCPSQVSARHC